MVITRSQCQACGRSLADLSSHPARVELPEGVFEGRVCHSCGSKMAAELMAYPPTYQVDVNTGRRLD